MEEAVRVNWVWNDPSHFEAHRDEFTRPVEEVLGELEPLLLDRSLENSPPDTEGRRWVHADWELPGDVGYSGLRRVRPGGQESFWAYRPGRSIPSHLTLGSRELTRRVCLWGWWRAPEAGQASEANKAPGAEQTPGAEQAPGAGQAPGAEQATVAEQAPGANPTFVIHTIYPGRVAPREIHDPALGLADLPGAIEFWRVHAIVTERGAYTLEPAQ